jgi:hypothetical protein
LRLYLTTDEEVIGHLAIEPNEGTPMRPSYAVRPIKGKRDVLALLAPQLVPEDCQQFGGTPIDRHWSDAVLPLPSVGPFRALDASTLHLN